MLRGNDDNINVISMCENKINLFWFFGFLLFFLFVCLFDVSNKNFLVKDVNIY